MIHEYALEPSVLSSWASNDRDYAEFFREYGLGTTRVVSSFPKRKASKLRSYLLQHGPHDAQSLTGQRYTEMVMKIVESIVVRDLQNNPEEKWTEAVLMENTRVPFDVVLSSSIIDSENCITPETMYLQGSLWNHCDQINFKRTNDGLMFVIANLIRLSKSRIVIVDPYGWTNEAIKFLQFMIVSISGNRPVDSFPGLTLYYKEKRGSGNSGRGSPSAVHVKNKILSGLGGKNKDLSFDVFELRESDGSDVFHNRCIITEHGGVITGHGIGVSGDEAHTDEAILMRPDIYQKKWQQFIDQNRFEVVSSS